MLPGMQIIGLLAGPREVEVNPTYNNMDAVASSRVKHQRWQSLLDVVSTQLGKVCLVEVLQGSANKAQTHNAVRNRK